MTTPQFTPDEQYVIATIGKMDFYSRLVFELSYLTPVILLLVWESRAPDPAFCFTAGGVLLFFRGWVERENVRYFPAMQSVLKKYAAACEQTPEE